MDSGRLMIVVLVTLLVFGLALSMGEAWRSGDWFGAVFSLGPELVGAVVTYALFDRFVGRREQTEAEKARLIEEMGSSVQGVAVAAVEKLRKRGWLWDGSLKRAELYGADLSKADMYRADLRKAHLEDTNLAEANLSDTNLAEAQLANANLYDAMVYGADLAKANLTEANLHGAFLEGANLQGAELHGVKFDESTTLPDGTLWTSSTDLKRFTDMEHPDFWNPPHWAWIRER